MVNFTTLDEMYENAQLIVKLVREQNKKLFIKKFPFIQFSIPLSYIKKNLFLEKKNCNRLRLENDHMVF